MDIDFANVNFRPEVGEGALHHGHHHGHGLPLLKKEGGVEEDDQGDGFGRKNEKPLGLHRMETRRHHLQRDGISEGWSLCV